MKELSGWRDSLARDLAFSGLTNRQLADKYDKSYRTISRNRHLPRIKEIVAKLQADKLKGIESVVVPAAEDAIHVIRELLRRMKAKEVTTAELMRVAPIAVKMLEGIGALVPRVESHEKVEHSGGVIIIPGEVSEGEWESRYRKIEEAHVE